MCKNLDGYDWAAPEVDVTYVTAPQIADLMPDARQLLSNEPEMESTRHYQQLALLVSSLERHWRERNDFFIGANLTVYYTHQQLRRWEFRDPDFFLVRDTHREPRNSWVVWEEEGRYPDIRTSSVPWNTSGFHPCCWNSPGFGTAASSMNPFCQMNRAGAGAKSWSVIWE